MDTKHQRSGTNAAITRHDLAILAFLLVARSMNALAVKTSFQPDEYFQSLEPAWQTAFGSESGAWITWEWREGLRSSLHPLLFAGVYRTAANLSHALGLNTARRSELLIAAPKLMQAVFAAAMDFFTYRLASRVYGYQSKAGYAALFLTALSPWQAFCSVRTLSNSIETTLTIFALHMWPWGYFTDASNLAGNRTKKRKPTSAELSSPVAVHLPASTLYVSLATAALACILRPTNLIIWATVSITLLVRHGSMPKVLSLTQAALLAGGATLAVSVSADRVFYNDWVLPPLRFLQFNLVQSLAVFYGKNRPDYYFTEGLPLLLTTALPFAAVGVWQILRATPNVAKTGRSKEQTVKFTLAMAVLTSTVLLSLISHKEVRFIYPLLPMLHILAAKPLADFFAPSSPPRSVWLKRALLALMISVNIFIAWYTLFVHQRGVIDVLHFLRQEHESTFITYGSLEYHPHTASGQITTVGFLMPCHSTPWRSHLVHPGIHAWALTCEPPLNLTMTERETYMDEADVFYEDPADWITSNIGHGNPRSWPDYLVFFEQLEGTLSSILPKDEYEEHWRGFNTHWHDDRRRQGDVIVWRKDPSLEYKSKAAAHKLLHSLDFPTHGSRQPLHHHHPA